MTVFDEATAVRRVDEGRYEVYPDVRFALVAPGGSAPPAVNGGVLIATMLRAVLDTSPHPHPVATSAHFLRVPQLAPAQVQVDWLRQGNTAATARAVLIQDGRTVLDLTVTAGTLPPAPPWPPAPARGDTGNDTRRRRGNETGNEAGNDSRNGSGNEAGNEAGNDSGNGSGNEAGNDSGNGSGNDTGSDNWIAGLGPVGGQPAGPPASPPSTGDQLTWTGEPPKIPPIEECVNLGPWPGTVGPDGTAGYAAQVDLRLDPATIGWRLGHPVGLPEMRGYFSLREDRDADAYLLALAVDGLPPAVFEIGATGWAPTVELTWYMRAVPVPGPLQVATRSRHVSSGWFDEEAEVWDAAGRLVAQSHQMARVGRGRIKRPT